MVRGKKTYRVELELEDYPAYAIDQLLRTGLYGNSREKVVENLVLKGLIGELCSDGLLGKVDEIMGKK